MSSPRGTRAISLKGRWLAALAPLCLLLFVAARPPDQPALIPARILAVNDLHGAIDSGRTIGGRPVGGAAILATHLKEHGAGTPGTFVVSAGDMIGASPPVSGLLREEPSVRVMNAIGFLVNVPGNHDFDRGVGEMRRLYEGGCDSLGCFEGSTAQLLAANVVDAASGLPAFASYRVETVDGVRLAFIGATHPSVQSLVRRGALDGLEFPAAAYAVNETVRLLQEQGIHAIVLLVHEGGFFDRASGRLTGPITALVDQLDPDVDLVVSAHTHVGYAARYNGRLVTQGFSQGTAFVDAGLLLDPTTADVAEVRATIVTTYADAVEPDAEVLASVREAEARVEPLVSRVVNVAANNVTRNQTRAGESALGDLITDAQRWKSGDDAAIMNSGGIRANVTAGEVSWGALYSVQPLANDLVSLRLSGEQLYALFNQQWSLETDGSERYRPLQVSGLRVTWDGSRPRGDRVVALSLSNGQPLDRAAKYRVTANDFIAGGSDGFVALADGVDRTVVGGDLDALVGYLEQLPRPFTTSTSRRIARLD